MAVLTACLKLDITMCSNRAFVEAAAAGSKLQGYPNVY